MSKDKPLSHGVHIDVNKRKISVFLVCTTALLDLLGYSMGAVVAPALVREVQGEPKSCCPINPSKCKPATIYHPDRSPTEEYYPWDSSDAPHSCTKKRNNRMALIGLPSTVYGLGSIISSFWLPKYSDKYGRKKAFLLSLVGSSLGFLGFALSKNMWMMLAIRFAAGLVGASFVVTNAYIFDVYGPESGPVVMTKLNALYMGGLVLAPVLALFLITVSDDVRMPLYVGASLSFCCLCASFVYMVEPKDLYVSDSSTDEVDSSGEKLGIELSAASGIDYDKDIETAESYPVKISLTSVANQEEQRKVAHDKKHVGVPDVSREKSASILGEVSKRPLKSPSPWKSPFNLIIGLHRFLLFVPVYGYFALQAVLLMEKKYNVIDNSDSLDEQGKDVSVQIGYNSAIASVCSIPVIYFLLHHMIKIFGLMQLGALSGFMFGGLLLAMPYTWNLWTLMFLFVLVGLSMGIFNNLMYLAIGERAPPDRIAESLAVPIIFDGMAQVVGPFLVMLYLYGLVVPFVVSAALAWIGSFLLIGLMCDNSPHNAHVKTDIVDVFKNAELDCTLTITEQPKIKNAISLPNGMSEEMKNENESD